MVDRGMGWPFGERLTVQPASWSVMLKLTGTTDLAIAQNYLKLAGLWDEIRGHHECPVWQYQKTTSLSHADAFGVASKDSTRSITPFLEDYRI